MWLNNVDKSNDILAKKVCRRVDFCRYKIVTIPIGTEMALFMWLKIVYILTSKHFDYKWYKPIY